MRKRFTSEQGATPGLELLNISDTNPKFIIAVANADAWRSVV